MMHESEQRGRLLLNGRPVPDDALARLLGLDRQVLANTLSTLLALGVASRDPQTSALINRRMVRDEELRKVRKECGKLGGNPLLVNQIPTTKVNQTPNQIPEDEKEDEEELGVRKESERTKGARGRPTIEEVLLLAAKIGLPELEAQKFFDYYESNGWKVGRNPMRSHSGALRNWKRRWDENRYENNGTAGKPNPRNAGIAPDPTYSQRLAAKVAAMQGNPQPVPNGVATEVAGARRDGASSTAHG